MGYHFLTTFQYIATDPMPPMARPSPAFTTGRWRRRLVHAAAVLSLLPALPARAQPQAEDCNNSQRGPCCQGLDIRTPEIPPRDKLWCPQKLRFYDLFPQLTTYRHLVFDRMESCRSPDKDTDPERLAFTYCVPNTRQNMKVEVIDLAHPRFETRLGKLSKDLDLWPLTRPGDANKMGVWGTDNIQRFDANFITAARFSPYGGSGPQVGFVGFHGARRYEIKITLDDPGVQFRDAKSFEAFIQAYVDQFGKP